jgi:hypothetical protein
MLYFSTLSRNIRNLPHQYKSNNNSLLSPTYRNLQQAGEEQLRLFHLEGFRKHPCISAFQQLATRSSSVC